MVNQKIWVGYKELDNFDFEKEEHARPAQVFFEFTVQRIGARECHLAERQLLSFALFFRGETQLRYAEAKIPDEEAKVWIFSVESLPDEVEANPVEEKIILKFQAFTRPGAITFSISEAVKMVRSVREQMRLVWPASELDDTDICFIVQ